jgi:hypothetical protein
MRRSQEPGSGPPVLAQAGVARPGVTWVNRRTDHTGAVFDDSTQEVRCS